MKVEFDDEPLFDYLDGFIENLPLEVLEQARLNTIKENEDTSILDKAIKSKKEKNNSSKSKTSLFDLFSSEKDKNIMSNNNYEPYQFEEEELEEDDYYYEDLD